MQNIVHALTTVYLAQIQMYKPEMAPEYSFWTWQLVSVSSNPAISLTWERPQQRKMEFIKFSSAPGSPVFTFPPLLLHLLLLSCVPRFPFKFMAGLLQLSCYTLPLSQTLALTDIDRHTCFVHRNKVWNQFGVAHMCLTPCD